MIVELGETLVRVKFGYTDIVKIRGEDDVFGLRLFSSLTNEYSGIPYNWDDLSKAEREELAIAISDKLREVWDSLVE